MWNNAYTEVADEEPTIVLRKCMPLEKVHIKNNHPRSHDVGTGVLISVQAPWPMRMEPLGRHAWHGKGVGTRKASGDRLLNRVTARKAETC